MKASTNLRRVACVAGEIVFARVRVLAAKPPFLRTLLPEAISPFSAGLCSSSAKNFAHAK